MTLQKRPQPQIIKCRKSILYLGVGLICLWCIYFVYALFIRENAVYRKRANEEKLNVGAVESHWFDNEIIESQHAEVSEPSTTLQSPDSAPPDRGEAGQKLNANPLESERQKHRLQTEIEVMKIAENAKISAAKEHYEALRAPSSIPLQSAASQARTVASNQSFENNPSTPSDLGLSTSVLSALSNQGSTGNRQNDSQLQKETFLRGDTAGGQYLPHIKRAPLSRYEVKAGTVIPATLITGINSDLPGNVSALVREHVYDSVTGNHLLIPQGAKLIGEYDSRVSFGQNRALVVWKRLIFPDGSSLNLDKMPGVDIAGKGGFKDKVNHHFGRVYGSALLLSMVGAGYELLSGGVDVNNPADVVAAAIGRELAQVASQMIQKNLNVQPTIEIQPGYRFNVLVIQDIILEKLSL